MNHPKISIITINYNNCNGLNKTIESILCQTYQNFEYIIIDGGSDDGSINILEKYSSKITYWESKSDKGIYNAMNKGIKHCSGSFLAFMNSGDCYLDANVIQNCVDEIEKYDADIYYGQHLVEHQNKIHKIVYPEGIDAIFLRHKVLNHQACFFKRTTLLELDCYDETYSLAADYQFYLKAFIMNKKFHPLLFPIVLYDLSGKSTNQMHQYKSEMEFAWINTIPTWGQVLTNKYLRLEEEFKHLKHKVSYSRILKFAFMIDRMKSKYINGRK